MRENGQILRPADPTSRPRFELPESEADLGARIIAPVPRMNRAVTAMLLVLVVLTVALLVFAALSMVPVWAPVASCAALIVFLAARSLVKKTRTKTAHIDATQPSAGHTDPESAPTPSKSAPAHPETAAAAHQTASAAESDANPANLAHPATAADATPTPVPAARDTQAVRGVINPAERHEAFLREVLEARTSGESAHNYASGRESFRYGALSTQVRLEDPSLEEREAVEETHGRFLSVQRPEIGSGLTVDDILERRRA